jgi:putative polyhydroxyalkanoate system protein
LLTDAMPKPVVVEIAHQLGRLEARERLQKGFGRIREQFGAGVLAVEERWDGDRLNFSARSLGQRVTGRVDVMETSVRIELDLPWALAMLAEKLQGRVKRAATLLLERK